MPDAVIFLTVGIPRVYHYLIHDRISKIFPNTNPNPGDSACVGLELQKVYSEIPLLPPAGDAKLGVGKAAVCA